MVVVWGGGVMLPTKTCWQTKYDNVATRGEGISAVDGLENLRCVHLLRHAIIHIIISGR